MPHSLSMYLSCHYACFVHMILINFILFYGRLYEMWSVEAVYFLSAWIVCRAKVNFERGVI